jgi:hypothetical protein
MVVVTVQLIIYKVGLKREMRSLSTGFASQQKNICDDKKVEEKTSEKKGAKKFKKLSKLIHLG